MTRKPQNLLVGAPSDNHQREERDFYPTPPEATEAAVDNLAWGLQTAASAPETDLPVYDPAAGNGALLEVFIANGYAAYGSELRTPAPDRPVAGVAGVDFLRTHVMQIPVPTAADPDATQPWIGFTDEGPHCQTPVFVPLAPWPCIIATNPPFSIAREFIRHAVATLGCPTAMLLKSDFWHSRASRSLFDEVPPSAILALDWRPVFLPQRGKAPLMNVSWSFWAPPFRSAPGAPAGPSPLHAGTRFAIASRRSPPKRGGRR